MNNLIPQKRLDKNGRLVTRHVKPNHAAPLPSLPVPVSPQASANMLDQTDAAVERVFDSFFPPSEADAINTSGTAFKLLMSTLTVDTLHAVSDRGASFTEQEKEIVTETLTELARRSTDLLGKTGYVESMLHYSAELAPILTTFSDTSDNAIDRHNHAMYLNSRVAVTFAGRKERLMFADEGEKNVIRGMMISYLITGDERSVKSLPDLSWLGENAEIIEPYKDIMRSHGSVERNYIKGLMETASPSLANGYL